MRPTARLVLAADLAGTFVFAVEGALAGIAGHLDLLGVLVLAFVTALGGGVIRDVLIGDTPPAALRDWRYPALAFAAGAMTFLFYLAVKQTPSMLLITLDAAGLALFAVAGTEKALGFGLHPLMAVLMGMTTGVGGGSVRDVLLAQVPAVLRVDFYASAALIGAIAVIASRSLGLHPQVAALIGGLTCFALRLIAVSQHWHLPVVGGSEV